MTVRLVLIAWTAGPLARHVPVDGDATCLVRPYVPDLLETCVEVPCLCEQR